MRKYLFMAALMMAPLAQADECRNHFAVAERVMEVRQEGLLSVVDMMEVADEQQDAEFGDAMRIIIRAAYEQPRFNTPANQRQAAMEFANEMYLRCQL